MGGLRVFHLQLYSCGFKRMTHVVNVHEADGRECWSGFINLWSRRWACFLFLFGLSIFNISLRCVSLSNVTYPSVKLKTRESFILLRNISNDFGTMKPNPILCSIIIQSHVTSSQHENVALNWIPSQTSCNPFDLNYSNCFGFNAAACLYLQTGELSLYLFCPICLQGDWTGGLKWFQTVKICCLWQQVETEIACYTPPRSVSIADLWNQAGSHSISVHWALLLV